MSVVELIMLLIAAIEGKKITVPVHVTDSTGSVDVMVGYDPNSGHVDVTAGPSTPVHAPADRG
jgi:hypothetical protein